MDQTKYVTATDIGSFYHLSCQLALWKTFHNGHQPGRGGRRISEITRATFTRGDEWERIVVRRLEEQNLILRHSASVPFDSEVENDPRNHFYVIGGSFRRENLFKNEYISRGFQQVTFGTIKPDLIEVFKRVEDGKLIVEWRVIDVKSSKAMKISHQAQVYFYWRSLQEILPESFVASSSAAIWLLNESAPTPFSPILLKPQIDSFLFIVLPKVISQPFEEVSWRYHALCGTCRWEEGCNERTKREQTISMIPDLTIGEAHLLREVIQLGCSGGETDIEELDLLVKGRLRAVESKYPRTASDFRRLMQMGRHDLGYSPVIEAVKSGRLQVIGKPVLHFPRNEDYAVIISLVLDAESTSSSPILLMFDLAVFRNGHYHVDNLTASGSTPHELIESLAAIIKSISSRDPRPRTQFYCFSSSEVAAINQILVEMSIHSESEDVCTCVGALVELPHALLSTIQPELLENALYGSWKKENGTSLEEQLSELNLNNRGPVSKLQQNLKEVIVSDNPSLRRVPKIVCIQETMSELVALPGPGYTNLQHCVSNLLGNCSIPSDDELYILAKQKKGMLKVKLRAKTMVLHRVIRSLLYVIGKYSKDNISKILVNEAPRVSYSYIQLCKDPNLRKLIFMHEYEVLLSLKELWRERADASWSCPIVEFRDIAQDGSWNNHFIVLEGAKNLDFTAEVKLYDWILCRLGVEGFPELQFDDLAFFNARFPVRKEKWSPWPPDLLFHLALAQPIALESAEDRAILTMQLYRSSQFKLAPGQRFRLLRRFVDFNTPKILDNFLEMDRISRNEEVLFLKLLENPNQEGHTPADNQENALREETRLNKLYRELRDLGNSDAAQLVFQKSQRRAMQSILKHKMTIIWGPPGTGKTHTLALATLYLLEIFYLTTVENVVVWITAVTNAAINAFVKKLRFLRERIEAIDDLDKRWLKDIALLKLIPGSKPAMPKNRLTVVAGTVWQLWNWNRTMSRGKSVDILIIDEAGQMNVGTAALAIRWLSRTGRLILAGDHLQLAPILKGTYPKSEKALFQSILHCLMREADDNTHNLSQMTTTTRTSQICVQLEENFRMNLQLCNFVELIYHKRFQPMHNRREIANLSARIKNHLVTTSPKLRKFLMGVADVMQFGNSNLMKSPTSMDELEMGHPKATSLFLMKLINNTECFSPSELHTSLETQVVSDLVLEVSKAFTHETIFVVTPHRVQRSLVTKQLMSMGVGIQEKDTSSQRIWIDTPERLQGSEADVVVCLFSHTHNQSLRRDLDFLYNRPRLNVAISRARSIAIVISSDGVLNPPVEALVDTSNLEGYSYLKAYEARAWVFERPLRELDATPTQKPSFSSQEFEDEAWAESLAKHLGEGSQQCSNHDNPE